MVGRGEHEHPNVVVARTFSKIYGMAGLRLGYAIGPEAKIAAMAPYASWSNANAAVLSAAHPADARLVNLHLKRNWTLDVSAATGGSTTVSAQMASPPRSRASRTRTSCRA